MRLHSEASEQWREQRNAWRSPISSRVSRGAHGAAAPVLLAPGLKLQRPRAGARLHQRPAVVDGGFKPHRVSSARRLLTFGALAHARKRETKFSQCGRPEVRPAALRTNSLNP